MVGEGSLLCAGRWTLFQAGRAPAVGALDACAELARQGTLVAAAKAMPEPAEGAEPEKV